MKKYSLDGEKSPNTVKRCVFLCVNFLCRSPEVFLTNAIEGQCGLYVELHRGTSFLQRLRYPTDSSLGGETVRTTPSKDLENTTQLDHRFHLAYANAPVSEWQRD